MEVKLAETITSQMVDTSFTKEVLNLQGGEKILDCIQCGVCGGSCPARFAMDYSPMQIIRMLQFGLKEMVLSSSTIWICASCYACATRCPRDIDITVLMSSLKNLAIREGVRAKIERKPKFHESFTEIVKKYGRIYEPLLITKLIKKTSPRALFHNVSLGFRLWRKGKISLRPSKIEQTNHLLTIFESALKEEA